MNTSAGQMGWCAPAPNEMTQPPNRVQPKAVTNIPVQCTARGAKAEAVTQKLYL